MRTISQILEKYFSLLNKENDLGYSKKRIKELLAKENEDGERYELLALKKKLIDELYDTEEVGSQTVSTLRAFRLWCDVILDKDIRTGRNIWISFVKKQFLIVERNKSVCYMAHRGSGKSYFVALYIAFKMFLLDFYDVCYCSNVPKQKRRFLRTFRTLIDSNELLLERKDVHGVATRSTSWGNEEVEYNNGILEGTTVGTTPRGGHYNLVIGDDPLRDDRKYTDEFIINYFLGTLKPTTYTKKARYILLGTPMHMEDLFHTLMNDKLDKNGRPIGRIIYEKLSAAGFFTQAFPAILNEKTKEVLVPEIWTYEELMAERGRIGDIRFNREMMVRCISYRNSLIGAALFKSCCDEKHSLLQKGEQGKKYVIFVDSATSDAPTADSCSMAVFEDDTQNDKFILKHLFHEKGVPITDPSGGKDDQGHQLFNLYNDFNKALVIVEKNNAGIALIQAAKALGIPDIIEHYTHTISTGKATKKPGKADDIIDYIEQGLKKGVIVFPANYEDIYTISCLEKVKEEHLNFGVKKGKSGEKYEALAGHDDIFDSCVGAWKYRGDMVDTLPMALTYSGGIPRDDFGV